MPTPSDRSAPTRRRQAPASGTWEGGAPAPNQRPPAMPPRPLLRFALVVALGLVALALAARPAHAQATGKITGVVTDSETGETLVGVSVVVAGSDGVGSATDLEGRYYILQSPVGTQTLRVTYVGYAPVTVEGVEVRSGLTSTVNVRMAPEAIEAGEVVVTAENPLVRPDITSTRRTTSREEMINTPGLEGALDVLRNEAGVVLDAGPQAIQIGQGQTLQVRDESVKNVHVRGGRGGEILFLVDGMPVSHPIYGGRSVLELTVNDVDQVELLTGAFSAEYGQAQSGVVNISTRSGGDRLQAGFDVKTDEVGLLGRSYDTRFLSFFGGGPLTPLNRAIPGTASVFVSGNVNLTNTPYDNRRTRQPFDVLGLALPGRQDNTAGLNARLDWRAAPGLRLAGTYNASWKAYTTYDWLWQDFPEHLPASTRQNHNVALSLNHVLSDRTFYTVRAGYLGVDFRSNLDGRRPSDFWVFYPDSSAFAARQGMGYDAFRQQHGDAAPFRVDPTVAPPTLDPLTGLFDGSGFVTSWRDDRTRSFTFKADLTSQVTPSHLAKVGVEVQRHDIRYVDVADGGVALSPYGRRVWLGEGSDAVVRPPGPFPEFGQNRWVFDVRPMTVGLYAQDKFELSTLIINAGLRLDGFLVGETVFGEEYRQTWEAATGLAPDWRRLRTALSPRLGISFPINTETVLFFSYGHFSQLPELQFYYRDPYTGGLTGNPGLDYELTILYEFGLTREVARDWAVDVKGYAKDISGQIGTTTVRGDLGLPVHLYDNNGYARARGLELVLTRRAAGMLSGSATYTVQWANGFASSAFENYVQSLTDFPLPIRERRLGWDTRHQAVAQGTFTTGTRAGRRLFGLPVPPHFTATVLSRGQTGLPYTPGTTDQAEAQRTENTATGPPVFSTDLRLRQGIDLPGRGVLSVFVDVFNLFDQNNVQIAYGFNPYTGLPYRYGDTVEGGTRGFDFYDMYVRLDPRQFSTGRHATVGLSLNF
jgi:outer membrane receptor protein involved in Fe transport